MLTIDLENNLNGSTAAANVKKKQKLVKHKRKNWRKTDISEVEQGIEELRKEERTGLVTKLVHFSSIYFATVPFFAVVKRCARREEERRALLCEQEEATARRERHATGAQEEGTSLARGENGQSGLLQKLEAGPEQRAGPQRAHICQACGELEPTEDAERAHGQKVHGSSAGQEACEEQVRAARRAGQEGPEDQHPHRGQLQHRHLE